ncbi:hypothetical protein RSOLAG1IB_08512 [Rhizoctonia solani AG-1 IB]|uniref:Ricin B lectin domain-containing protein n=1 Tax=Thanatephorus cucumeris (strain AG1-IB / isolate 7/3/14) TaxID=1108050 RepID=A0A0B7FL43_THACB|nr:hypothetical protein RSOLAG1IB_08512 [Rhizoctonia solani AG-1 IB]
MAITPGTYRIKNAAAWTTIDQSTDGTAKIHGWKQTDQANQHWQVEATNAKSYTIKNLWSKSFLHAKAPTDGCELTGGSDPSLWYLDQMKDDGSVYITYPGSNKVVDLDNGSNADGAIIHLWEKNSNGAKQQRWFFEKI